MLAVAGSLKGAKIIRYARLQSRHPPGVFKLGFPALYFLVHASHGNLILPLARLFNREQVKPTIAAYRKLVFLEKDGSKRVGVVSEQLKAAQDGSNKDDKTVYRFVNGTWLRCKNFHNKAKVVAKNVRKFDERPDQWKIIAE